MITAYLSVFTSNIAHIWRERDSVVSHKKCAMLIHVLSSHAEWLSDLTPVAWPAFAEMNKVADRQSARCYRWKRQRHQMKVICCIWSHVKRSFLVHLIFSHASHSAQDREKRERKKRQPLLFCQLLLLSLLAVSPSPSLPLTWSVFVCVSWCVWPAACCIKRARSCVPLGFTRAINRSSHVKWALPWSLVSCFIMHEEKKRREKKVHLEFTTQRTNTLKCTVMSIRTGDKWRREVFYFFHIILFLLRLHHLWPASALLYAQCFFSLPYIWPPHARPPVASEIDLSLPSLSLSLPLSAGESNIHSPLVTLCVKN